MAPSAFAIFEPRMVSTKRKRAISNEPDELDSEDDRQIKRSFKTKSRSKVYAQLPTPDDSSDDEDSKIERNVWYQRRALAKKISICSINSIQVNLDDLVDDSDDANDDSYTNMGCSPLLITTTTAVKNKYSMVTSPSRALTLLTTPPNACADRLPTPTTTANTIDHALRASFRRSWHAQILHTNLSPVTCEEISMLSPAEPLDPESMMILDHASDTLKGLNVYCADDSTMQTDDESSCSTISSPNSGYKLRQQENSRTARLHMGYRADCKKCTLKVPGHCSHILWS